MNLVAETPGDIKERNSVKTTCSVCMKSLTGQQMMSDGNFFITLPVQLSFLLSDESVANALLDGLNSISQRNSTAAEHVSDNRRRTVQRIQKQAELKRCHNFDLKF